MVVLEVPTCGISFTKHLRALRRVRSLKTFSVYGVDFGFGEPVLTTKRFFGKGSLLEPMYDPLQNEVDPLPIENLKVLVFFSISLAEKYCCELPF